MVPLSLVQVTFAVSDATSVNGSVGDAIVITLDVIVQNGLAVSVTNT